MDERKPLPGAGPALSAETIEQLERQLGAPLPDDYRQFLLASNGGTPERAYFVTDPDSGEEFWVDYFYAIDDRLAEPTPDPAPGTLAFWMAVTKPFLPPDTLPIACVARDSFLLLYLRGPRRGQVHLIDWDEVEEVDDRPTAEDIEGVLRFLAPSFNDLLERMYAEKS